MRNTYLYRLWRHSKLLSCIVIVHMLCSVIFIHSRYSPYMFLQFFLTPTWIMYTSETTPRPYVTVLELEINGEKRPRPIYLSHKDGVFTYTLNKYASIVENGGTDPALEQYRRPFERLGLSAPAYITDKLVNDSSAIARFPAWIRTYLANNHNMDIRQLRIDMLHLRYNERSEVAILKRVNLINE